MICKTNVNQLFFLFFNIDSNEAEFTYANDILKWRITWMDELQTRFRDSKKDMIILKSTVICMTLVI